MSEKAALYLQIIFVWIIIAANCVFQWVTTNLDSVQSKNIELLIKRVELLEQQRGKQ